MFIFRERMSLCVKFCVSWYFDQIHNDIYFSQVELKLKETTTRLEQQLAEEQAARLKAEEHAQQTQIKSSDEIRELREHLQRAEEELRKRGESRCTIL